MKRKLLTIIITVAVTLAICTVAAMYTPPGFGHSVSMLSNEGGMATHPVLLGLNQDNYVILVTGTVIPPYRGGFRIVLEGENKIDYKILSRYPPEPDMGYHHFHQFTNDTVRDILPLEKFALIVSIRPKERISQSSHHKLNFYDLESGKPVLSIPVSFTELANFNISKAVRRPYPEHHGTHTAPPGARTAGTETENPSCH